MEQKSRFTVRQVALMLGCTLKFVYDLLYAGRLQGASKVGRVWRIPRTAVEARLKTRAYGADRGRN